jgi:cyclopropane fatty-acyl-phospholipid synthase-like methyltransferase/ABC-type nitrate/sulfonate/bicarbonate transport system substrate-binding protein
MEEKNDDIAILRVAGVPEHFNEPWKICFEENLFLKQGINIEWHSVKEGTGAMINKLKSNEVDIIVALTEGLINDIANGSDIRLIGTYVQSPLVWSVSTGKNSIFNSIEDLKGEKFGISRYQSGSHLMSCVLASQYGWKQSDIQFVINHNFDNLRKSVNDNTTAAFMWEYFMQKPFYDKGEIRQIGQIITPWPCFMIATTKDIISQHLNHIEKMFIALQNACLIFRTNSINSIERISKNFHLTEKDAQAWFDKVNIIATNDIAESTIETTIDALKTANIINTFNHKLDPIRFIDTRIAKLTVDIKSMRLYNKPELLIALRNNLRVAGLSKGQIKYTDLLPFDQNHYYGTQVLDLAVDELNLNNNQLNINNSTWILQIGSNLAGCARYLAGKYDLQVLAIELQNDLSQAATELTDRCDLSEKIHHITGNFLTVAQHLQENIYTAIVSWLTILHFNQEERIRLFNHSYRLLKQNGFFYCEDFIRIGNITNEESQILEHDVYCRYLPTLDQYKSTLQQQNFQIIKIVDLTNDWKIYTKQRLEQFQLNKNQLIEIHGEEIYYRLEYFYQSIVKLFTGENVGGVRIIAQKQ